MRSTFQTAVMVGLAALSVVFAGSRRAQELEAQSAPGGLFKPQESESIAGFEVKPEYLREEFDDPTRGFVSRSYHYIVQSPEGDVIGHLRVVIEPVATGKRNLVALKKSYDFAGEAALTLTVEAESYDPRDMRIKFAGGLGEEDEATPEPPAPMDGGAGAPDDSQLDDGKGEQTAHYYYDTVSVSIRRPGATTLFSFRRPLPSYDLEELLLLLTVLDTKLLPARSVWYLTAPFERATYAVLVERVGSDVIYGADAERHLATRLRLTSELSCEDYFIESLPPHRVVKFTAGDLTFTLWEDTSEGGASALGGAV